MLWPTIWQQWCSDMAMVVQLSDAAFSGTSVDGKYMEELYERWRLGLKIVRRLMLRSSGDGDIDFSQVTDESEDAKRISGATSLLVEALSALLERRRRWMDCHRDEDFPLDTLHFPLWWGPKKIMQILTAVQEAYPYSSRQGVPEVLRLCYGLVESGDGGTREGIRMCNLAMLYIAGVSTCSAYFSSASWNSEPTSESAPVRILLGVGDGANDPHQWRPFSVASTIDVVRSLVTRHIKMTKTDFDHWSESPENYQNEEMSATQTGISVADETQKCRAGAECVTLAPRPFLLMHIIRISPPARKLGCEASP